jgi:hypothetical protein
MVSIIFEHIECENKMMILFFFFPFFIRYLAHLHFQCYIKSPPYPPTPTPLPTHSPFLALAFYSAIKKNEFMKFLGKWMDLEGIILSEVTHSQRNSHNMYSLISGYFFFLLEVLFVIVFFFFCFLYVEHEHQLTLFNVYRFNV